jgi:hypothetical protein
MRMVARLWIRDALVLMEGIIDMVVEKDAFEETRKITQY